MASKNPQFDPAKLGRMRKRPYKFGPRDIMEVTGLSMRRIWMDRRAGKFTPTDLRSLMDYLVPQRKLYYELLYEVEGKYDGETRHETARRLIRQAQTITQASQAAN